MGQDRAHRPDISNNPILNGLSHVGAAGSTVDTVTNSRDVMGRLLPSVGRTTPFLDMAGKLSGVAGTVLGPIGIAQGVTEIQQGNTTQGVMDVAAGGLGFGSALTGLAGVACPALGLAAATAGFAAYGNGEAQNRGWYGQTPNGDGTTRNATIGEDLNRSFHDNFATMNRTFGTDTPEGLEASANGAMVGTALRGARDVGVAAGAGVMRMGSGLAEAVGRDTLQRANESPWEAALRALP